LSRGELALGRLGNQGTIISSLVHALLFDLIFLSWTCMMARKDFGLYATATIVMALFGYHVVIGERENRLDEKLGYWRKYDLESLERS
jgi:hypothetical protein